MFGCKADFYFLDNPFSIEIDENDHDDRDIEYEIKRKISIEEKFGG